MSDSNYVFRFYRAKCDCGSMSNYLNVLNDHGFVWKMLEAEKDDTDYVESARPYMNATDFVVKESVTHFGRCSSEVNKGNIFDKVEFIMGLLLPGSTLLKKAMGCDGCKCKPIISDAWGEVDKEILVNGVPIITEKSKLYCRNGGVITIEPVESDQGEQ